MINYKPKHGDMEMWLICTAIGEKSELLDKMKKNEDGSYPIVFTVGGVEVDFTRVAKRIDEQINNLVEEKAKEFVAEKYESLFEELNDIQERLENQKNNLFQYDWEKNKNPLIETEK